MSLPFAAAQRDPRFLLVRGKGGKERVVPLSEPARQALADYLVAASAFCRSLRPSRWLFPSRGGAGHLTRQRCGQLLKELAVRSRRSIRRGCRRMCCAMPLPAICSITAPICAASSRCSGMPISRRRRSTPMFRANGCAGWSRARIRWPAANDASLPRFRAADRGARRQDRRAAAPVDDRRISTSPTRSAGSKAPPTDCCARPMRG